MRENSASKTAIIVAKAQALIAASPGLSQLVPLETRAFIHEALRVAGHSRFVRQLESPLFRKIQYGLQILTVPGLALHQVLRKQLIEERVITALNDGVDEVIQIGAGLDSLCYRLHQKWPRVHFREFDHPATQTLKEKVIQRAGSVQRNFTRHHIDLGNPNATFQGRGAETQNSRLVIIEGVFMYLPQKRIIKLLRQWREDFGSSSRLLFTFFSKQGFENQKPLVNAWLSRIGEPFLWWVSKSESRDFLNALGWTSPRIISTKDRAEKVRLGDFTIATGEWIAETKAMLGTPPILKSSG